MSPPAMRRSRSRTSALQPTPFPLRSPRQATPRRSRNGRDAPQFPVSEKFDSPDGESETAPAEEDIDRPAFFRRHFSGAESAAGDPAPEPERTDAPQLPFPRNSTAPRRVRNGAGQGRRYRRPAFFRRRFK